MRSLRCTRKERRHYWGYDNATKQQHYSEIIARTVKVVWYDTNIVYTHCQDNVSPCLLQLVKSGHSESIFWLYEFTQTNPHTRIVGRTRSGYQLQHHCSYSSKPKFCHHQQSSDLTSMFTRWLFSHLHSLDFLQSQRIVEYIGSVEDFAGVVWRVLGLILLLEEQRNQ